ncbi:hypothetical protein [Pseudalkalibacillus caeni]|uniref:Uncharacterized protein n=1 Tax=Exobacillus caeni TaxID=2574798 RepID=A0A5R9F267_9BACL|nr:hypothetical protein [Pseudalkalibacillus caeni]TLS37171.1 hypothetical protein FCL54_11635 [Pseudalkalibacillus caeni]
MSEVKSIKVNALMLLMIIPLSLLGYYFAVEKESLFFIYEGLFSLLIVSSVIMAMRNIVKSESSLKWVSVSILAFLLQLSVLGIFLGPFSFYSMFYLYYVTAIITIMVYVISLTKAERFKFLPVLFIVLSVLMTFYMIFLNMLWGKGF